MRDSGRSITITTPSYGPRRFNVIRCALQSITFNFSEIPRRSMPIGVLGKRITKTTPSHGPGRFNVIRCAPQSITFNTFTISAIPDFCLLSPLSMPFELSLDIIYRIQMCYIQPHTCPSGLNQRQSVTGPKWCACQMTSLTKSNRSAEHRASLPSTLTFCKHQVEDQPQS